jgi:glycosyltransferase involved in cell wall biosynthesis
MKIALVSGEFPPMEGGVGAFTQELARALADLKQEVHIITSRTADPAAPGQRFGRLPEPTDLGFAQLHAAIKRWRWPSVSTIADLTLRYEFDVVNIQYQAAAYNMNSAAINILPWRLKHIVRTVVTFHDLRIPYLFPKAGRIRHKAVSFMAKQSAGIVTTNTADFEKLNNEVQNPLTIIPIGSNIKTYKPNHIEIEEARENLGLKDGDILLGYFGFVNESKGADVLVKALAQLPETYHLVFIGGQIGASDATNQDFAATIHEIVDEGNFSGRVHWTGFMDDKRVATFLEASDLIVMPYRDGVSLRRGTLMAAIAQGCTLVTTTPTTPLPDLVHGQNVWFVDQAEREQLSKAILTLVNDDALRMKLSEGAKKLAKNFSWEEIANRTLDFYQNIEDPRRGEYF